MIRKLCEFLKTFDCSESAQKTITLQEKVDSLEKEIIKHINQIQECKAIHDYQAADLEKKINELEEENALLKNNPNQKDETC